MAEFLAYSPPKHLGRVSWLSFWHTPLFFSPQELGDDRNPASDLRFLRSWPIFWRIRASKITSKKHRKKCENRGFWPPKTLPKAFQNACKIDVPTSMRFFSDFGSKKPLSQECRHRFRIGRANTKWLSDTFLQIAFGMPFGSEKPTKNHPKTRPEALKIDAENVLFFNLDFFASWPRFWRALGPQDGAKLAHLASKNCRDSPF